MINRKKTYDNIRLHFGKLSTSQVEGFEATFDEWELWVTKKKIDNDKRKLAYIIATDWHEGGKTMQPIKEWGGEEYYVKMYWTNQKKAKELGNLTRQDAIDFCGKGKPMITGRDNYTKMGKILNLPLAECPNIMFNLNIATKVMFEGMLAGESLRGDFTGLHLGHFFNDKTDDPKGARKVVNGSDKDSLIAFYHTLFLKSIIFL